MKTILKFISATCASLTISLSLIAADYGNTQKTNPMRGKVLAKEVNVYSSASSSSPIASFSPIKQGDFVYFDVRDKIITDGIEWLSFKHTDGNTYYVYAQLLTLIDNPTYGVSPARTPSEVASAKPSTTSPKADVSKESPSPKETSTATSTQSKKTQTPSTNSTKSVTSAKSKQEKLAPTSKETEVSNEGAKAKSEKPSKTSNLKVKWGIVSVIGILVTLLVATVFFLFKKLREL